MNLPDPGDSLLDVSRALVELEDVLRPSPVHGRAPDSPRNLDRAAILVSNLSRRGLVVVLKADYDLGILALRDPCGPGIGR